ncbi:hypothetical protein CFP56_020458 [Quercus suber]|uniref:Uncharacterized protein n=1 Tax=Quercus suber TaxID=58331 RepID=A0AAW0M051_QUESU
MHTGAQPRPSSGVEVREATSIHEAGGDRRRGFEAIGAGSVLGSEAIAAGRRLGLRRSPLGRGLGRRLGLRRSARSAASGGRRKKKKKWQRRRGAYHAEWRKEEKEKEMAKEERSIGKNYLALASDVDVSEFQRTKCLYWYPYSKGRERHVRAKLRQVLVMLKKKWFIVFFYNGKDLG